MIVLTSQAEQNLRKLMQEDKADVGLRIYVPERGCHGYQYGMAFESNVEEDDTVIEKGDLKIILDWQARHCSTERKWIMWTACKAPDLP